MARRRLTPAQPGYLAPAPEASPAARPVPAAPIAQVSGQSAEAAALREMSHAFQAARDEGRMVVEVPLTDIAPGHLLRDRMHMARDEMDALKASIQAHGQRTPAEIVPLVPADGDGDENAPGGAPPYRFGLVAGWRRLTVLNELHAETGDPRFSTLRALICARETLADSYVAMVEENEIRVGLSYYERARVVAELARSGVFPDRSAAVRTLFGSASKAKRSKIVSFIDIYETLGPSLRFPAELTERLGLALVARLRRASAAEQAAMRRRLEAARAATPEAERQVLETLARPPKARPVSQAMDGAERIAPGLALKARRSGRTLTLTLSGESVDDALLARALQALRGIGEGADEGSG